MLLVLADAVAKDPRAGRDAAPVYQGHARRQEGEGAERRVPLLRGLEPSP